MKQTDYTINNQIVSYSIEENGYTIYLGEKVWITQNEPYIPYQELGYEGSCLKQIEELAITREQSTEQEELNAEMLLNQVTILENQQAQDEVLAEILLNQVGGIENV